MKNLNFIKMHGLGNDFVIIDSRDKNISLNANQIKKISDRRFGVGCDQFVVIINSDKHDCYVEFYNSDGSSSGACGNASRCVAWLIMNENKSKNTSIETIDRVLNCVLLEDDVVSIEMGSFTTNQSEIPLLENIDPISLPKVGEFSDGVAIGVGNPHAVYFVKKLDKIINLEKGLIDEVNILFPEKANISIVEIIDRNLIKQRVWERGVGETLACGTGACAAVCASFIRGYSDNVVKVNLKGGVLDVVVNKNTVTMSGKVEKIFEGVLS